VSGFSVGGGDIGRGIGGGGSGGGSGSVRSRERAPTRRSGTYTRPVFSPT
jgi:hypothetical protein